MLISLSKLINSFTRKQKQLVIFFLDISICMFSFWLAYSIRLESIYKFNEFDYFLLIGPVVLFIIIFLLSNIYNHIFRYSNTYTILQITIAIFIYAILSTLFLIYGNLNNIPRSLAVIQSILILVITVGFRLFIVEFFIQILRQKNPNIKNIAIYSTSHTAVQISRSVLMDQDYKIVCFIDDDIDKINKKINNIKILTSKAFESKHSHNIQEIIVAQPKISLDEKKQIINKFEKLSISIKFFDSFNDHIKESSYESFKLLIVDDFIKRKNTRTLIESESFHEKTVLISGAGGSIGSQLCRQIIMFNPKYLILLDHSELNIYNISQELDLIKTLNKYKTTIFLKLGSVKDYNRLEAIFYEFRPDYVYHTAAYKHVPIVEENILEAIDNNIIGTKKIIEISKKVNVKKFVFVSTDKAVRPTNIMGATKRIAEMCVQSEQDSDTVFSIVRFGNVFGSSGSVVPLFYKQIMMGGPLTVTDERITRYLMSIPEAAELIIKSSLISKGGEVFVLDMGEPIKIIELAKRMIAVTGHTIKNKETPRGDIEIKITGLRPGEKLHEELFIGNNYKKINNSGLFIASEEHLSKSLLSELLLKFKKNIELNETNKALKTLRENISSLKNIK